MSLHIEERVEKRRLRGPEAEKIGTPDGAAPEENNEVDEEVELDACVHWKLAGASLVANVQEVDLLVAIDFSVESLCRVAC